MAEQCLCCGKKVGIFTGSHLNNTLCDNCYFKFASQVEGMRISETLEDVEKRYENILKIIDESGFLGDGKKHVIEYVDEVKKKTYEKVSKEENALAEEAKRQEKHDQIKERLDELRKDVLLTTGNNLEGYDIIEYCGVKSGSAVLGTGFLSEFTASLNDISGTTDNRMGRKVEEAKVFATNALINNCIYAGGNAIIGIGYDIMTIGSNMIVVSANGTSVRVIKKKE